MFCSARGKADNIDILKTITNENNDIGSLLKVFLDCRCSNLISAEQVLMC